MTHLFCHGATGEMILFSSLRQVFGQNQDTIKNRKRMSILAIEQRVLYLKIQKK